MRTTMCLSSEEKMSTKKRNSSPTLLELQQWVGKYDKRRVVYRVV
jgi:hypothetical protein